MVVNGILFGVMAPSLWSVQLSCDVISSQGMAAPAQHHPLNEKARTAQSEGLIVDTPIYR